MSVGVKKNTQTSYELYREIAEELCVPVDPKLDAEVRYELYNSKLVYLKNLYDQCFKEVNNSQEDVSFTQEDLRVIHKSINVTQVFLRETILEALESSLSKPCANNKYSVYLEKDSHSAS